MVMIFWTSDGSSDVISLTRAPVQAQIQGTQRRAASISGEVRCEGVATVAVRMVSACSGSKPRSSSSFQALTPSTLMPAKGLISSLSAFTMYVATDLGAASQTSRTAFGAMFCESMWSRQRTASCGVTRARSRCSIQIANRSMTGRQRLAVGDFRRGCELVGDLTIVAEAPKAGKTSNAPAADGLRVRLSDRKHFGAALLFATGSAAHIQQLQALAAEKGMRLETDGLHKGGTPIAGDEADIYHALGLPFIDPELREGRAARSNWR